MPRRLADAFRELARQAERRDVQLGELTDISGDRGFGFLFTVLSLPAMIPVMPPGYAASTGVVFAFLGSQMLLGLRRPWLPRWLKKRVIPSGMLRFLVGKLSPILSRLERSPSAGPERARRTALFRLVALTPIVMGLVMALPVPFLNTLPALGVLLTGMGLLRPSLALLAFSFALSLISLAAVILVLLFGSAALKLLLTWQ